MSDDKTAPGHDVDEWVDRMLRANRRKRLVRKVAGWACAVVVVAVVLAVAVVTVQREIWLWRMYLEAE